MTKKSKETKTISLSLNFNNENQYYFTVKLSPQTPKDEVWDLTGVNSAGETFELEGLGKALMRLLGQLGHATKKPRRVLYRPGYWRIHAPRKKHKWQRHMLKYRRSRKLTVPLKSQYRRLA